VWPLFLEKPLKVYCLVYLLVLSFMARFKSSWKFLGSIGSLHFLLELLFRSGLICWLKILRIGTLRARYRAEHRNVANNAVSTIDNGGEAHVAYEDGDE
jgi:hypothetical protein